jgi:WD40 repeat protein
VAGGARQVRVFVSSPGDARFERSRLERVIERLNGEFQGVARLSAVRWETEFYKAHQTFQAQIPEAAQCDIVFAIFRSRLGTALPFDFTRMENGEPYPSGTAYEVLSAIDAAKARGLPDVYVFRFPDPPSVRLDDPSRSEIEAQWERLKTFFETWFRTPKGMFTAAFQTFSSTDDFEAQAEALLHKWLEAKVLHGRAVVWPIEIKGSPFRGLAAFGFKHAPVFFGRGGDVAKAVDRFKDAASKGCPFLLVNGASGSGKSSLVRAGLVPRLTDAGVVPSVDMWRVAVMRPEELSGDPFGSLATALFVRSEELPEFEHGRPSALPELSASDFPRPEDLSALLAHADATALKPAIATLDAVAHAERRSGGYERDVKVALLLVVDQLDELFGLDDEVRARFAKLLDLLARSKRVWVLATLRADLYDRFLGEPVLKQLKEDGASYDLSPPEAAALAEIIRGPAAAAGLDFEKNPTSDETLDERLLEDAGRTELLPLLQFTLNQLFEEAKQSAHPELLSFVAYRALGGIEGAVDKEAEAAMRALSDAEQARLPRLLRDVVVPAHDGGVTTRAAFDIHPVSLAVAAYDETSATLVRALVDARILLSSNEGGQATLRLAHARVLDAWQRAKAIVAENADFYRIRADVEEQREKWEAAKRSRDLLIGRGRPLAEAESVVRRFADEIPTETRDFITRSGRRARLTQTLSAAATAIFAVVAGAAFFLERQAVQARQEAEAQRLIALVQTATSEQVRGNLETSMRLGLLIARGVQALGQDAQIPALRGVLGVVVAPMNLASSSGGFGASLYSAAFSPDGARIVTAEFFGTARIWDAVTGKQIKVLKQDYDAPSTQGKCSICVTDLSAASVFSAAFGPDATRIVTASADKTARIWDTATGKEIKVLRGHTGAVNSAAFSPDATRIVTASADKTARIWDTATGKEIKVLRGHTGAVNSAAFSPDGARIITASSDQSAYVWDANTGNKITTLRGFEGSVESANYSPDGAYIVTASNASAPGVSGLGGYFTVSTVGTARIWDAATATQIAVLTYDAPVHSAVFSPDGKHIATVPGPAAISPLSQSPWAARVWDVHFLTITMKDLVIEDCIRRLRDGQSNTLNREEMRLAGYSNSTAEIDVCKGIQ